MTRTSKVHIIRDSIAKIVIMLTERRVKVTQRGAKAYVAYNKVTGAVESVNIPYLPDDATEDFIAAVQGFLDHEVGHVLFTESKVVNDAHKCGQEVSSLANVIEDVYIERKMQDAFAGSVANLESVRKFYLYKVSGAKLKDALKAGDTEMARGYAIVTAMRAWGGQVSAQDYIKDPEVAALIAPVAAKLGEKLIAKIAKCDSSRDCLNLAKEFHEALNKKPPPPPAAPPAPPPPKGAKGEPSDEADPGDDSDNDEAGDKGKKSNEKDDSGKERDKPSKADDNKDETDDAEQPPAEGDEEGKDSGSDEAEPEDEGAGASKPENDDADGGGQEDEAPSAGAPEMEGEDDAAGGAGGDDADEETGQDETGGGADEAGEGEGSAPTEDGDRDEPGAKPSGSADDSEPGGGGSFEGEVESSAEDDETFGHLFDKDYDFDKEVSEAITGTAIKEIMSADYRIYSPEWDVCEPAPKCREAGSVTVLEDAVAGTIGVMQKQLERAMAAQARKTWNPAQRKGRIHPGGLFKTATGDDRVFRTRFETRAKNTAVGLLVDCSGSMSWGNKIKVAGIAAYAISCVLERLRVTHEIMGFTTKGSHEMKVAMEADRVPGAGVRSPWARDEALYHPVYKGFHERLSSEVKQRIASMVELPRWMRNNVDGESVQFAGHRLMQQRAERHVLMVLSDGDPACTPGCPALRSHLRTAVKELQLKGVEVVGIGIQSTAVQSFYDKYVVLESLEALPTTVMGQITKLLLDR